MAEILDANSSGTNHVDTIFIVVKVSEILLVLGRRVEVLKKEKSKNLPKLEGFFKTEVFGKLN